MVIFSGSRHFSHMNHFVHKNLPIYALEQVPAGRALPTERRSHAIAVNQPA
jgi:hypothetical protein